METMDPLVKEAQEYSTWAHGTTGELRLYTGDPYIVHPAEVVSIVEQVPHTPAMLAAAWLHDLPEKVPGQTVQMLYDRFGEEVGGHVEDLTDVTELKDGSRAVRKARERERIAKARPGSKTVKLGDILSNTRSIVLHDPKFAKVYVPEKALQLLVLTDADPTLLGLALRELVAAAQSLNVPLFGGLKV